MITREKLHDVALKGMGYLLSGGIAAVVDIGLFYLFAPILGMFAGAVMSFLIAAFVNFFISARYVFKEEGLHRAPLFLLFATIGLGINVSVTMLAWRLFGFPPVICKGIGVAVAVVFNFAFNYLIVFRKAKGAV